VDVDEDEDQVQAASLGRGRVDEYRALLRRRLLDLRPEVNEPDHDPWCHGLGDLFVPRHPWRTCDRCEEFQREIERLEKEPLGLWPDPT